MNRSKLTRAFLLTLLVLGMALAGCMPENEDDDDEDDDAYIPTMTIQQLA
jgi:hypothetical protein